MDGQALPIERQHFEADCRAGTIQGRWLFLTDTLPTLSVAPRDGSPRLLIHGEPDRQYRLQTSTDLRAWNDGPLISNVDELPLPEPQTQLFFRLKLIPN